MIVSAKKRWAAPSSRSGATQTADRGCVPQPYVAIGIIHFPYPQLKTAASAAGARRATLMATNPPSGDGHRNGQIRQRSQAYNPYNNRWTKRDTGNGQFIDQKADSEPFKGVRKERPE